jgi:oligoendopeptidase F
MYLYLRYAVDTRDEKSRDEGDALDSEVNARTAFLNDALLRLPAARVTGLMKSEPKLELYRYAIESVRRFAPHTLSEPEEKMLALSAPKAIGWQFDLYQRLLPGTQRADGEEVAPQALGDV